MSSALGFSARRLPIPLLLFAFALVFGCDEETTEPKDDALILPALTSPENVISAIEVIYNDKTHSAADRLAGYASLLDSAFTFTYFPNDIGSVVSWGLEGELAAHECIFGATETGDIHSLELQVQRNPAGDLNPPEAGRDDWQQVFATYITLRLMYNIEDGLEVNGAQAIFKFPPAEGGHFKIGEWIDLPRPLLLPRTAVEPSSWGAIKDACN